MRQLLWMGLVVLTACFGLERGEPFAKKADAGGSGPGMDAAANGGGEGGASGGSEGGATTGGQLACTEHAGCPVSAPKCAKRVCSACQLQADCSARTATPACDVASGACVACNADGDCASEANAKCDVQQHACVACDDDAQCAHVAGKNVCLAGACVECTREKATACSVGGATYVCDPTSHACDAGRKARSKRLCNACVDALDTNCKARADCVSDDECQIGQACVDVPAGGGMKVCLQVQATTVCPRPFGGLTAVSSADGPAVTVCTFSKATTCQAHADYKNKRCGTPKAGAPAEDEAGSGDDSKCGVSGLADGYCVFWDTVLQYRCTVRCGAVIDCPPLVKMCGAADHLYSVL